jgi:photosystem II stability/assembly factor-like uncharacterized protein
LSIGFFAKRRCFSHCAQIACALSAILFVFSAARGVAAPTEPWTPIGPDGGDARALASAPGDAKHLYLGSTTSLVYESLDGGAHWRKLVKLGADDSLVVDHIVVDAGDVRTIYVAGWTLSHTGGGMWVSHDAGLTWTELKGMHEHSIRSFAQAASDTAVLFAGTLEGVYRSVDRGETWTLISPAGSTEIHEVESLAIDPKNTDVVYAGTWHLPWKTTDGGKSWHNIKKGVIDDSDVFSIIIDPERPRTVYASACSGIYKSETAGELFRKIQGIPATARRTRVLKQDPEHRETVYAGTTEGLYKTVDGGHTFKLMTDDDVIVNDVWVDPADTRHVLLATDRAGVLTSVDGGAHFTQTNSGISERKVAALLVDRTDAQKMWAGVVNDKRWGGVFVSQDGGSQWAQLSDGLDGRDVFALAEAADGTVIAGTSGGIFALEPGATTWKPRSTIVNTLVKTQTETVRGTHVSVEKREQQKPFVMDSRVYALDIFGETWLASTQGGVYTSHDQGATWQGSPVLGVTGYLSVAAHDKTMAAALPNGVVLSHDAGATWWPMGIPTALTRIHRVAFSPDGTLWIGAREGVYFTRDSGKTWMWVHRLPLVDLDDLYYDARLEKVVVSSRGSDFIYAIDAKTLAWTWWQTGFRIATVRTAGSRLVAASLDNGVLAQPEGAQEVGRR